jgi:hypothetical protein
MGNTFGKRTLAPGFHQGTARALGPIPGKTTRVQQELGAGLDGDAAGPTSEDIGLAAPAHGLAGRHPRVSSRTGALGS